MKLLLRHKQLLTFIFVCVALEYEENPFHKHLLFSGKYYIIRDVSDWFYLSWKYGYYLLY
jgi:hypothetical protein